MQTNYKTGLRCSKWRNHRRQKKQRFVKTKNHLLLHGYIRKVSQKDIINDIMYIICSYHDQLIQLTVSPSSSDPIVKPINLWVNKRESIQNIKCMIKQQLGKTPAFLFSHKILRDDKKLSDYKLYGISSHSKYKIQMQISEEYKIFIIPNIPSSYSRGNYGIDTICLTVRKTDNMNDIGVQLQDRWEISSKYYYQWRFKGGKIISPPEDTLYDHDVMDGAYIYCSVAPNWRYIWEPITTLQYIF